MARSSVVLPTPLRPSTQVTSPGRGRERDAAQRLAGAVVDDRRPSTCSMRSAPQIDFDDASGRSAPGRCEPSASTRALVQHRHLDLADARTNSMSCSTTTTEWSPAMLAQQLARSARSRRRSCRRPARRPAAARVPASAACRSPATASGRATELAGEPVALVASRPDGARGSRRSGRARRGSAAEQREPERRASPSAPARGSPTTVWLSNTVGFWNLRPMPRRAISASSMRGEVDVAAGTSRSPLSGRVLPVMTSIIVVLPAPFGPMMARISPASKYERERVQRLEAVEADA